MLRIGIVGAGPWARTMHRPVMQWLQASGKVQYCAVVDVDAGRATDFAQSLGCRPYGDLASMTRSERPDALAILVNSKATAEVIRTSIRLGLPFLAEKPPAPDTPTHLELAKAAGDLPHVVGYNRRHSPYLVRAREWLEDAVPQVVCAQFARHRRFDEDFSTTAVHPIDTSLHLAGSPLRQAVVECAPAPPSGHRSGACAQVLNYFVACWTQGGTRVQILITPDTASAVEHYVARSTDRTVAVSFPQLGMIDYPGFVELQEANRTTARLGPSDFGIGPSDSPSLGGIRDEHLQLVGLLDGSAHSISTLASTISTQRIRQTLATLMRRAAAGKEEVDLTSGS